ncbi:prohibitin family protein [Kalamiella sp. sgz302252]|uniref:prohibitin family protein n=1 Tax=Pantoea sp. sgz302252 TaxID=3341827 RepID=UPI0036D390F9
MRQPVSKKFMQTLPVAIFAIFAAFLLILMSFYTVKEGERGVLLRYGKIVKIAEPGLGFKIPFIETVKTISIHNHAMLLNSIQTYSRDQQPATMSVSVNYHVPASEVEKLYISYTTLQNMTERLIARQIPTQLENVFGQYTAISAVQDRAKLVQDVQNALRKSIVGPVMIDSVQVENIDFSDAYEKSIEDRMKAEVAIATRRQNLETEKIQAQIAITQAEAEAASQLAAAKAEAESIRLKGAAEAEAIRLRGQALRDNPSLVSLTTAERWDGKLPATMVPGGSVPFISVK